MADEVTLATLLSNGGRVAKILSAQLHMQLHDPQTGLRDLMTFRPLTGPSGTLNVTSAQMAYTAAAASSETSGGFSNTAFSTGNFDLTPARYALQFKPSNLFAMTAGGAAVDVDLLVQALVMSVDQTLASMLTSLFSSVSGNVGTSGVDLTASNFFDAIYTLNLVNNPRALAAVLHNRQVNDLIESFRGETGAIQYRQDIQAIFGNPGTAYRADILGVRVYQSDKVPTANTGADRQGCMFSDGAFGYTLGDVGEIIRQGMINPADIIMQTPEMFIERSRDAANGLSTLIMNIYPGVVEQEDARAVKITTDA